MEKHRRSNQHRRFKSFLFSPLWTRAVAGFAAIVIFSTTYWLILPASALTKNAAADVSGLSLEQSGEILVESEETPEDPTQSEQEEPAAITTAENADSVPGPGAGNDGSTPDGSVADSSSGWEQIPEAEQPVLTEETTSVDGESASSDGVIADSAAVPSEPQTTVAEDANAGKNTEAEVTETSGGTSADTEAGADAAAESGAEDGVNEEGSVSEAESPDTEELSSEEETTETEELSSEESEEEDEEKEEVFGSGKLLFRGNNYSVTIEYGEDAKIPGAAELRVRELEADSDEYQAHYETAKSNAEENGAEVRTARFFDITIVAPEKSSDSEDAAEESWREIEPAAPVKVNIVFDKEELELPENAEVEVLHFADENNAETVEKEKVEVETSENSEGTAVSGVGFDADAFSVFGVVGTTIEKTVLAGDGHNYKITVTYGEDAKIPANADLSVEEIMNDSAAYSTYVADTENILGMEEGSAGYIRLFDIKIVDKDDHNVKYQPAGGSTVNVRIELADAEDGKDLSVVHFADDEDLGKVVTGTSMDGQAVEFATDGFSVYAVVDEEDTSNHARMALHFMNGATEVALMYVKNNDSREELDRIIYDPGVGDIPAGNIFKGWWLSEPVSDTDLSPKTAYTVEDAEDGMNIEEVRDWAAAQSIEELTHYYVYSMQYKNYVVNYLDENEVGVGSDNVFMLSSDTSSTYTVNMTYTPKDDTHNFEGWNVKEGGNNIAGHTSGKLYENGNVITISGDVTFSVNAPEGHWLVFNENGKGATYNAPVFVKSEDTTTAPTDPTRFGYTFGGWYTATSGTADETGYIPVDESSRFTFGSTISDKTTLYAKWTPAETANYTVIIWKENVSGEGYDFGESISLNGNTGTYINTVVRRGTGDDSYVTVNGVPKRGGDYQGFHLDRFDENVMIKPEGDAILNVYYDRNEYTLRFYYARSYVYGRRTYVQVNVNDEGFLQGRSGGRSVAQSLTRIVTNDYGFFSGGNTWKDINANGLNGDATNLITSGYKQKVTLGTQAINGVNTYVVSNNYSGENNNNATLRNVDMTYYYFDVKVNYGQSLVDVWPVPNTSTYNIYNGSGYNTRSNNDGQPATGIRQPIRPIHQGFWATGNGVSGMYSTVDPEMFAGNSKTAYFITYWRFQEAREVTYRSYFSVLEDETADVIYKGKGYKLHETFTALTGEPWQRSGRATDTGEGWDIGTVTYDGTTYASGNGYVGREDGQNPNVINAYYDRVVNHIIYNDGIYVDGDNNPLQNRKTQQLHTKAVVFGSDLSSYNKGEKNYWRPDDTDEYVFEGWYLDSEGQQPYTFSGTMPQHDITVYAKWRQRQYRVFLHPNAGTDPTLDWGSTSQAMNFRISYNGTVSTPSGKRAEYEFVGWYTDPSCTAQYLFTPDTKLNAETVSTNYDKTTDFTDPMDKWGNGATWNSDITGYNGGDRFWITKKLDLYGKWRAKIVGANGIGVIYDLNGGTGTIEDNNLYLDQAQATAQSAPTPPANKQFVRWVVQRWEGDDDTGSYTDTTTYVYPGDSFEVLKSNAHRQVTEWEADEVTPKKATYTVQLKAEYVDIGVGVPTHIHFYANIHDKEGNSISGVTPAPEGNEPRDVTTYNNVKINEAKDILTIDHVLNGSTKYIGYKFLGWAKSRDAEEPWLKLNADGQTYTVEQDGKTYNSVTKIAADEVNPYEDLYAVWEKKTYTVTVIKETADTSYQDVPFTFLPAGFPSSVDTGSAEFKLVGNLDGATVEGTEYPHEKVFTGVPYGTSFRITEAATADYDVTVKYDCSGADDPQKNVSGKDSGNGQSITVDGNITVTFTNTAKTIPLKVVKIDQSGNALAGATFEGDLIAGGHITTVITGSGSTAEAIIINNNEVPLGTYTIRETDPPTGYYPLDGDVVITIENNQQGTDIVVGAKIGNTDIDPSLISRDPETGVRTIKIRNSAGTALPSTGGSGTRMFTILGGMLILIAGVMLIKKRRLL